MRLGCGTGMVRAKNFWLDLSRFYCPVAKSFNGKAMARRHPETTMPPRRDEGNGDAELLSQLGGPIGVNEGCETVHASKFTLAKQSRQGEKLVQLNHFEVHFSHTKGMNIPWYVKAKARLPVVGLNQKQFAELMGVSGGRVSQWFSGDGDQPLNRFPLMAEVLKMTIADLIADDASFAKTLNELKVMELLREVPADQQGQALEMFNTIIRGLKATPPPPPPPRSDTAALNKGSP